MKVHIGELIKQEMDRQGMKPAKLADMISVTRPNIYSIVQRENIDIILLERISKALNKNFFQLLATDSCDDTRQVINNTEKLESLSRFEKEIPDTIIIGHPDTTKNRQGLKVTLQEYFSKPYTKPLLIVEKGYTFGAAEVVRQMAVEQFGQKGYGICPKHLNIVTLQSLPYRVLSDYIDKNTYGSEADNEQRLSEIFQVQQDVKKHFVSILHVENKEEIYAAYDTWKEQFHIVEYTWDQWSLLSWAKDSGQPDKLIEYIKGHHVQDGIPMDFGVPNGYPTEHAYTQRDFEYAAKYIDTEILPEPQMNRLYHFIKEIREYCQHGNIKGYQPLPIMRKVFIGIEVNGNYFEGVISLPNDDLATLVYLYDMAVSGPLKGLDEDDLDEQFYPWLQTNHPKLANSIKQAAEDLLIERLGEDAENDYRDYIPHTPPSGIDDGWTLDDKNEYKYYLGNLPERVVG